MRLEATRLSFSYGAEETLRDFSVALGPGDFTVLLGPNGSGKSTALKLLAGFLTPASGEVRLDGTALNAVPHRERARRLAVVPQVAPPALDYTVGEMVMMGRYARQPRMSPPSADDLRAVEAVMDQLELTALRNRGCNRLSGGERQRVAIAAALAQQPGILLLDEPTSALDPEHAFRVMELLKKVPSSPAILMISHDLDLALRYADTAVLLNRGRVHAAGPVRSVLDASNIREVYHCRAVTLEVDAVPHIVLDR